MNITHRPITPKPEKAKPDPAYLARVRELPCCICDAWGLPQRSPTQAHHPIHDRHGTRKTSDRWAIPLCEGHHQGLLDVGKTALHRSPEAWRTLFGPDHAWIAQTQDKIEGMTT